MLREFARGFTVSEFIISFALLKLYCGGDFKMCMYIHLNYAKNAQKMHQAVKKWSFITSGIPYSFSIFH